jgi:uncharacterized protein
VAGFFVLACLLSWIAWAPLALAALGWIDASPSPYLHLVGGLGPALAALVLSAREGAPSFARLARQIVRGRPTAVLAAVAVPLAFYLASAAILVAGGYDVDVSATGTGTEYPELGVASYMLANLVFYGFGEEIGWRGFALPRMRARGARATRPSSSYVYLRSGGSVLAFALFHGTLDILINSPTGGPLQTVMGALVTVAGILCIAALRRDARA